LIHFDCSENQLTALPALPVTLRGLTCSHNQLIRLPELPAGLTYLDCYGNQLTALPDLPVRLRGLYCDNNNLTVIPELPARLSYFICYNNQLTSLPDLPAGLFELNCDNNPFLPELQEIIDTYHDNLPQLIITVNYYNTEKRRRAFLRQAGREIATLRSILPALPGNTFRANDPFAKISRNYKLNYMSYGPRKQRKSLRKKRKQRRKTRRN